MSAAAAFLQVLAKKLHGAGVPWMLTGSAASSYYGEPRATNDLDIVVDPTPAQIETFATSLSGSFYVSREEVREALAARGVFNVIDPQSGGRPTSSSSGIGRYGIRRLAVFGSAIRGELERESDLDILVEFEPGIAVGLR